MNTLNYLLKKFDLTFNENTVMPIEIPNVGRNNLPLWLKELDFKTGIEVGVAGGEYSEIICLANPQMKVYGVDPWEFYEDYVEFAKKEERLSPLYDLTVKRLAPYPNYEIMRQTSMDALKKFKDESLDFAYIDANHQGSYVMADIIGWSKKVRPGGIISGHDYFKKNNSNFNVIETVDKYVKDNNIRPWFLIGLNAKIPGMTRDRSRSWMWIKENKK